MLLLIPSLPLLAATLQLFNDRETASSLSPLGGAVVVCGYVYAHSRLLKGGSEMEQLARRTV